MHTVKQPINRSFIFALLLGVLMPTAQAATLYVSVETGHDANDGASWSSAKKTIQAAVDAASAGDTVLVAEGVYDQGDRLSPDHIELTSRVVIDKPITVRAVGGAERTTIVGRGPRGVSGIRGVWMTEGATLDGFTVTNGNTFTELSGDDHHGGGIWCASTNVFIKNCTIVNSQATGNGGGVYRGTLINSTVKHNYGYYGGGVYGGLVKNSRIEGNSAFTGGGCRYSTVHESEILNNRASDFGNWDQRGGGVANSTVYDSIISGNRSLKASGALNSVIYRSSVTKNTDVSTSSYDAASIHGSTVYYSEIRENSFGGSSYSDVYYSLIASNGAYGAYKSSVYNCVVSFNNDDGLYRCEVFNSIAYKNKEDGFTYGTAYNSISFGNGKNNFYGTTIVRSYSDDPIMVDPARGDYRLKPESPYINRGDGLSVDLNKIPLDFQGFPRVSGDSVDIGPFEYLEEALVRVEVVGNGRVTPEGMIQVPEGGSTNFVFSPNTIHKVGAVYRNGALIGTMRDLVWDNATGINTLRVEFVRETNFAITVRSEPAEGGTVTGAGVFRVGTEQTITADPAPGYLFTSWSDGNTNAVRRLVLPEGGIDLSARFIIPSRLPGLAGDGSFGRVLIGSSLVRNFTIANHGTLPLTITNIYLPDGFRASWAGVLPPGTSSTFNVVFEPTREQFYQGDMLVQGDQTGGTNRLTLSGEGYFKRGAITLEASPVHGGVVNGAGTYPVGSTQTITAVAVEGWQFDGWSDGNAANPRRVVVQDTGRGYQALFSLIPTRIIALPGNLAFGEVEVGDESRQRLVLKNIGNSALTITNLVYSDASFQGTWTGAIPAGGTSIVEVIFSPAAARSYAEQITVQGDQTGGDNVMFVSGIGLVPRVALKVEASPAGGGTVTGGGTYEVGSTQAIAAEASADWQFDGWSDGNTDNPRVVVVPSTGAIFQAMFSVIPTRLIGLSGVAAFGEVELGSTMETGLIVTNRGNTPLTITNVVYPAGFSVDWSGTLDPGGWTNVVVTFAPEVAGPYAGVIIFEGDQTGGTNELACSGTGVVPRVALKVEASPAGGGTVTGGGTYEVGSTQAIAAEASADWQFDGWSDGNTDNPRVVVVPSTGAIFQAMFSLEFTRTINLKGNLAFGSVLSGQSKSSTLIIANDGNSPLTVTNVTYSDPAFSGSWSGVLAAGASTNVQVLFSPDSILPRSYNGTVTIWSDANSGSAEINVTATSWPPGSTRIVGLSGDFNFGEIRVGEQVQRALVITNRGNSDLVITNIAYTQADVSGAWSGVIAAGRSTNVLVTFAPTRVQEYNGMITVQGNSTEGESQLVYTGTGLAGLVTITLAASPPEGGEVTGAGTYEEGSTHQIEAKPASGWNFTGWSDGNRLNPRTISITNRTSAYTAMFTSAFSRVIGLSGNLNFGAVAVGGSSNLTMVISNRGNARLTITDIEMPSGFSADWNSGSLEAGQRQSITVTFTPTEGRPYNGLINIVSDRTSGINSVPCLGEGIEEGGWDDGYESIGGGWRRSSWFGDYVPMGEGWIYHNRHGFWFALPASTPDSIFYWTMDMGWLWTSSSTYTYLYRFEPPGWLYYEPNSTDQTNRWFLNMSNGNWFSIPLTP